MILNKITKVGVAVIRLTILRKQAERLRSRLILASCWAPPLPAAGGRAPRHAV